MVLMRHPRTNSQPLGRRVMLLNARQVFDEGGAASALLLAIEDVTHRRDAEREKDELLRQKKFCCRRCNTASPTAFRSSLASFFSRLERCSPRRSGLHLQDAHQRVMSVATVQEQLQASGLNESIEIGPYLTKLCDSLAKSMVGERRPLSIHVEATSGRAVSSEAVSLGLIVTELVINALKHAFPGGRAQGAILVKYENDRVWLAPFGIRQWGWYWGRRCATEFIPD